MACQELFLEPPAKRYEVPSAGTGFNQICGLLYLKITGMLHALATRQLGLQLFAFNCHLQTHSQQRWYHCWSRLMDLLMDLAIDLPIRPPPVTDALRGWMFIVDCMYNIHVKAILTENVADTTAWAYAWQNMEQSAMCLAVWHKGHIWYCCFSQVGGHCLTAQQEVSIAVRAQHRTAARSLRRLAHDSMLLCQGSSHLLR